ncbi:MAG: YciI family protein [Actinoplanes sp.]
MPQYAVTLFERAEMTPELIAQHEALDARIAEKGGRTVAGMAFEAPTTATSIRGDLLTDGPFIETKEMMAGLFIIEANDLDHALALARMTPVIDGGVEVRPLIDFSVVNQT